MNGMLARLGGPPPRAGGSWRMRPRTAHPVAVMRTELGVVAPPASLVRTRGRRAEDDSIACRVSSTTCCCWRGRRSLAAAEVDVVDLAEAATGVAPSRWTWTPRNGSSTAVIRALRRAVGLVSQRRPRLLRVLVLVTTDGGMGVIHVGRRTDPALFRGSQAQAVERFVRLDGPEARDAGGAELGLAIASEVAARAEEEKRLELRRRMPRSENSGGLRL